MEIDNFVVVDLGSNKNHCDESEAGIEESVDNARLSAGFEWAAEPDEMLIPWFATKWLMFGLSCFLVVVSIICWICSHHYSFFVWVTISTLFMGLIIFLPEYFSNIINFAVNFCVWVAYFIFLTIVTIQCAVQTGDWDPKKDGERAIRNRLWFAFWAGLFQMLIAAVVIFLMFRMLYYYYLNRGDAAEVVAIAA